MEQVFKDLPMTITYIGFNNGRNQFDWNIKFSKQGSYWSTIFHTGIGWRSKPKNPHLKPEPVKPTAKDVMYCLLLDADAANYNFSNWCSEFGYSDDSIAALNMYKSCLDTATALRKYCTPEQITEMKTLLEDY